MIRNGDLDRDPREVRYGPRPPAPTKLDRTRGSSRPDSPLSRTSPVCGSSRSPRRRLQRRDHAAAGLRPQRPATAARGRGRPVRDTTGPPGAGGLRALPLLVGRTLRAAGGARLLAPALAALLPAPGHAHPVSRPGAGIRLLRRRAARATLRPDALRHRARPAAASSRMPSSCASATTGASVPGPAGRTGPRRRERSNDRSATSAPASSTAAPSSATRT